MRNRFPVVGRDAELAVVDAALDGLAAGAGGAVEVVGDPGMGKTTLLRELWIRAGRRGVPVLRGHAQEDTAGIPFALIHEALVAPGDPLLRALAEPADRYPRYRRFRGLIEEQARPGGLVLALDDVHWADPASADLLAYLLRRPPAGPVLMVLARRERPVPVQLAASLEEAVRGGALRRLRLRPLRRAEAAPLLRGVAEAVRDRVYELSEGCPLYLEALCTLAAGGVSDPGPLLRDRQLPGPVAAVLLRDLAALGPLARLVAEAAAVVGDPVDADLVARVAPCPAAAVLDGFDELVARDILRCVDAAVWFRHPLVREATYWSSGAGWRMAAHARAVAALRERGQSPVRCAHHVERSVSGVDPRGAELLILAAQEVAATAPAIAARWYGAGLELCGGLPQDPSRRADLLIRRARMLGLAGQLREARDALRGLLATAALDGPARVELVASTAALQRLLGEHEPA
ncbi:MAG TPA: AAA family ATPase, partial [Rugosimonospora sp.]|nr:AAA family ATPase [Rugosimonospora sp.]